MLIFKEDAFDGGQLSTPEKTKTNIWPKKRVMKIHWWSLRVVFFGISDVADDLVRGALVEMKADIIESVWRIEGTGGGALIFKACSSVKRALYCVVCVYVLGWAGGIKHLQCLQSRDLTCVFAIKVTVNVYGCRRGMQQFRGHCSKSRKHQQQQKASVALLNSC